MTTLDLIGGVLTGVAVLAVLLFPMMFVPTFEVLYSEFGGPLPALTQLMMTRWSGVPGAMISGVVLGAGLYSKQSLSRRRALVVAGFVSALVFLGMSVIALYLPIFELSSAIR